MTLPALAPGAAVDWRALDDEAVELLAVAVDVAHAGVACTASGKHADARALLDHAVDAGEQVGQTPRAFPHHRIADALPISGQADTDATSIVLIAGDSDFVPAAKLARREGIDFILDPMWNPIHPSLNEHIDGLRSTSPNPARPSAPHELDPPDEGRERRSSPAHHQHA